MKKLTRRICAAAVLTSTSLAFANTAGAVDLRDWGRKYNTASERFVVLASFGNQAVLDKETQLVWPISPQPARDWTFAVSYCHASHTGGRAGWRLPSISELTSLLGTDAKLPTGHPFNIDIAQLFWSSTDLPQTADGAYAANLLTGGL